MNKNHSIVKRNKFQTRLFQTITKIGTGKIENKHFNQNLETRVVCERTNFVLGAALRQFIEGG